MLLLLGISFKCGLCQVKVAVRLDQPEYLVGEPIFVLVDVTNTGIEALGYSASDGHVELSVPGGRRKTTPDLRGCFGGGIGGGSGGGISHPPLMQPGQSVSFPYLLRGYWLEGGHYLLHAFGDAGVRWFFGAGRNFSSVSRHKIGDVVEGRRFDVSIPLAVREGSDNELKGRYRHYVEEAMDGLPISAPWLRARQAIAEMAPPFLEKTLLRFVDQPESAEIAVEGLAQIPTATSRADLVELYDKTPDLKLRGLIVEKLAGIATPEELSFFASLLPGHSSALEDRLRIFAALGIGRIGGDGAVDVLKSASQNSNPELRRAVATALGNTRSGNAVPVLIGLYPEEQVRNDVCWALATLTHYRWCGGDGNVMEQQSRWRRWWDSNQSGLPLYGMDQCIASERLSPIPD